MSKVGVRVGLGLTCLLVLLPLLAACPSPVTTTSVSLTSLPPATLTTFFPPVSTQQTITFVPPDTTTTVSTLPTLPTISTPTAIPTGTPTAEITPSVTATNTPVVTTTINTTTPTTSTTIPSTTSSQVPTMVPPAEAKVMVIEDLQNDFFDSQAKPVQAEPYRDIRRAEAYVAESSSFFRLKLAGTVPGKIDRDDLALEWDFFIDADMNPATGWTGELIANDTGPDYLVRLVMLKGWVSADLYDVKANKTNQVTCEYIGDTINFAFNASLLKLTRFNLVVVTRKWLGGNLAAVDKAPDQGHYNLPKGLVIVAPGLPAKRMESKYATIWYNDGNDERATLCAEAFDAAYAEVNRQGGLVPSHPTLYVYTSRASMMEGMQVFSQFSKEDAALYQSYGAPRPAKYITHIPPDYDWRAIYQQQVSVSMDLFC